VLSKKKLLKLGLVSIAAITIGAIIGLVFNYQTIRELREGPKEPPPTSSSSQVKEEKAQEKIATYSGKIKPSLEPEIAAHYLEGSDGKITIFLKSGEIESGFLGIIEGQTVEVVGRVETLGGGQEVLEVDEVRL